MPRPATPRARAWAAPGSPPPRRAPRPPPTPPARTRAAATAMTTATEVLPPPFLPLRPGLVRSSRNRPQSSGRQRVGTAGRWPRRNNPASDEALIRTLYEEHGRALLAYATRLTGDRAAAEDVVQETLVRAWKHAEDLVEGRGSVRGWLLTVARNIVTDRVRARAARPTEVPESP